MTLNFHHVNICASDVPEADRFYGDVLGLGRLEMNSSRILQTYTDKAAFRDAGAGIQWHMNMPDANLNFRTGHAINPVARGHLAFRTDDIEQVKARLQEHSVPFSEYGEWAMKDWYQIFFNDPTGQIIEVHQVVR
jgi:catechol 2,3-dioxygenase-like lactoylglutathione lyase family enzyme